VPLYDFRCRACEARFEAQVPYGTVPPCPSCAGLDTERQLAPFAGPFTVGMRGYAARQSNASRAVREEQRRERRAAREAQRRQPGG
jgi:putative FmdB family regulatory protein